MPRGIRGRRALALAALGGGGVAALTARVVVRRREVNWQPPDRTRQEAFLSVQTLGDGNRPVVLLHPLSGTAEYFGAAYDELGGPGPLVVPDLLGFGLSPRPEQGFGPEAQVAALARTLGELGITGPALWVGHGTGGVLAILAASRHPELVQGVVAVSPLLYRSRGAARQRLRQLPVARGGGDGSLRQVGGRLADWQRRLTAGPAFGPEASTQAVRELIDGLTELAGAMVGLEADGAPVRLVLPANDPVIDAAWLAELSCAHPRVSMALLPFGDHRLPLTHPDGLLVAIDRFRDS
ncbi:MAG: alpha/beta fold hydrolase, partial [Candidatus Dormibacteria bacterium]